MKWPTLSCHELHICMVPAANYSYVKWCQEKSLVFTAAGGAKQTNRARVLIQAGKRLMLINSLTGQQAKPHMEGMPGLSV